MNFITLKELKKMVPVASEFKRVPGLKKILEDGIEVILRKQMENHAEVVVYKNGYVSYHAHERYTVFALHNCTHYYYESQGNEHQTIPHNHFEDMEWHIRLVLEGEDRLVRNLEARESETFSYAADVNPEYNNEMEDPRINVMDFVLNKEFLRKARIRWTAFMNGSISSVRQTLRAIRCRSVMWWCSTMAVQSKPTMWTASWRTLCIIKVTMAAFLIAIRNGQSRLAPRSIMQTA